MPLDISAMYLEDICLRPNRPLSTAARDTHLGFSSLLKLYMAQLCYFYFLLGICFVNFTPYLRRKSMLECLSLLKTYESLLSECLQGFHYSSEQFLLSHLPRKMDFSDVNFLFRSLIVQLCLRLLDISSKLIKGFCSSQRIRRILLPYIPESKSLYES